MNGDPHPGPLPSPEETVVGSLRLGLGLGVAKNRNLDSLAGTWVEGPESDKAIEEQDRVGPRDWE